MTDPTPGFITTAGQTIAREKLIAYLNTGTSSTPQWDALGLRVEDSTMDYDWSDETSQDILGNVNTVMKKPIIKQTFEPLNLDSGDSAIVKIWEMAIKDQNNFAPRTFSSSITTTHPIPRRRRPRGPSAIRSPWSSRQDSAVLAAATSRCPSRSRTAARAAWAARLSARAAS